MLRLDKKDIAKQMLMKELKKSNKTVEKIKKGRTIVDENEFRKTF